MAYAAADTASCGSYAIVRHARVTVTTGTCAAPGEVAHSLWTEVCVNYNCATTPARSVGGIMPDVIRVGPGQGKLWRGTQISG